MVQDLKDFQAVLRAAEVNGVRRHLAVDFWLIGSTSRNAINGI